MRKLVSILFVCCLSLAQVFALDTSEAYITALELEVQALKEYNQSLTLQLQNYQRQETHWTELERIYSQREESWTCYVNSLNSYNTLLRTENERLLRQQRRTTVLTCLAASLAAGITILGACK